MQIVNTSGFSMTEVLVTLFISVVGLLGISMMQLNINKATVDSGARSHAIWIIDEITNKMYANWDNLQDYDTTSFSCGDAATSCMNGTSCNGQAMAKFDIWSSICPQSQTDKNGVTIRGSAVDYIPNPELTIRPDLATRSATITVRWVSRVNSNSSFGGGDEPGGVVSLSRDIQL